jgi:hypothetical protein
MAKWAAGKGNLPGSRMEARTGQAPERVLPPSLRRHVIVGAEDVTLGRQTKRNPGTGPGPTEGRALHGVPVIVAMTRDARPIGPTLCEVGPYGGTRTDAPS